MKKLIIPALVAVIAISALSLTTSKAFADTETGNSNGFRRGFNAIAEFLDITTDELRASRDGGKTTLNLIEEQGKTREEFQQYMQDKAIERMTERGFSDEEISERLEMMAKRRSGECNGTPKGPSEFSMGKGRRLNQ